MSTNIPWPDESVAILERRWLAGHTASAIGAQLGVSRCAVVGKAHRLGIIQGEKPGQIRSVRAQGPRPPAPRQPPISREERNARRRERRALAKGMLPAVAHALARRSPTKPAAPDMRLLETADLTATSCVWPLGDPSDMSTFRYCGATRPFDRSYCEFHAQLAYTPARPKVTGLRPMYR
jgi:GcrA cell cycle regulator